MAAKMSKIKNDLLPYEAGFVVVTQLDENMLPDPDRVVVTPGDYLISSQYTEGMSYEEVATGRGNNTSFPTQRTDTLALTMNAFSPVFHNAVTGKLEYLPEKALSAIEFETNLPAADDTSTLVELKFGTGTDHPIEPAADKNGNYRFVIRDNKGNYLTKRTTTELGTYVYDSDTKTLQFSSDYAGMLVRIIYDYEDANATVYRANPILKKTLFKVEAFGLVQSATGETYKVKRSMPRASISGDIPSQPTQKERSASLTYTFAAEPVPTGESPYEEVWTEYSTGAVVDASSVNIANGCDDNFTKPGA